MSFLNSLWRVPSTPFIGDSRVFTTARARKLTTAKEGVLGGTILELVGQPVVKLCVGLEIAITTLGSRGPSFFGTIRSIAGANQDWTLLHVRGEIGEDRLLLAPRQATQLQWRILWTKYWLPDEWLEIFPTEPRPAGDTPQFDPSRPSSPSTPPEPVAPPPSFTLDDAASLLEATARLMADERREQLRPWLRSGCPGQATSLAEHIDMTQSMSEARQAVRAQENLQNGQEEYIWEDGQVIAEFDGRQAPYGRL